MLEALPQPARLPSDVKEQTTRRPKSFAGELDRLSVLGMAAGKDINDELTFILNYAEESLGLLGPAHPAGNGLVELTHAAMRCAETIRCLLVLTQRARQSIHDNPR